MGDNRIAGLYNSTARTTTPSALPQPNQTARGLHLVINVTAKSGSPSVTPKIWGIGPTAVDAVGNPSGAVDYLLLAGAPIDDLGTTILKVYPGIVPVASAAASDFLPVLWKATMEHANTDSITYSVFALLEG